MRRMTRIASVRVARRRSINSSRAKVAILRALKRKSPSIAVDLKALLERALNKKTKLGHGEREQIVTKAAAGVDKLVNQFAKGDRYARRDLIALAEKLGIDLTAGQSKAIENSTSGCCHRGR